MLRIKDLIKDAILISTDTDIQLFGIDGRYLGRGNWYQDHMLYYLDREIIKLEHLPEKGICKITIKAEKKDEMTVRKIIEELGIIKDTTEIYIYRIDDDDQTHLAVKGKWFLDCIIDYYDEKVEFFSWYDLKPPRCEINIGANEAI